MILLYKKSVEPTFLHSVNNKVPALIASAMIEFRQIFTALDYNIYSQQDINFCQCKNKQYFFILNNIHTASSKAFLEHPFPSSLSTIMDNMEYMKEANIINTIHLLSPIWMIKP